MGIPDFLQNPANKEKRMCRRICKAFTNKVSNELMKRDISDKELENVTNLIMECLQIQAQKCKACYAFLGKAVPWLVVGFVIVFVSCCSNSILFKLVS